MKIYVVDTNALISFVTDRNPKQQAVVGKVFEQAARLKHSIVCPQHVIIEFVFVLDRVYGVRKREIHGIVADFISMPGVELHHHLDMHLLLSLWPSAIADFGDAVVATVCKMVKRSAVLTFDRRFVSALKKAGIPCAC